MFSGSTGQNASGEGVIQGDTNTWNVADGWTKINVLKPLIEANLFETMAKFGKQNLEDEFDPHQIAHNRVEGFDRMMFVLRQTISNTMFKIDRDDKEKVQKLIERLDLVESVADGIASDMVNDVTKEHELRINEDHFRRCLDVLTDIKQQLNSCLNKAGLIFRQSEETDLDEFMRSVYEG